MIKTALFVEGQTEKIFIERLVIELFGAQHIACEVAEHRSSSLTIIKSSAPEPAARWQFLIVDCGGDGSVASAIRDNHSSLTGQGYIKILGIRDVYPRLFSDIPRLESSFYAMQPKSGASIELILAIMEVESWFIAEYSHFQKIHANLTVNHILSKIGIDVTSHNIQSLPNPAVTLHQVYGLVGYAYNKRAKNVQRTVDAIDYYTISFETTSRLSCLNKLVDSMLALFQSA